MGVSFNGARMSLLDHALAYAASGWYVFMCEPPIAGEPTSGKRPITDAELGLVNGKDDATTDADTIKRWWSKHPNANIGIAVEPSGLVVLDVDITGDKQGAASLAAIDSELTPTLTARTGSGGVHAVYARGDAPAMQHLHVRPGLDLLGKGYIVAAPSKHYSGGTYEWVNRVAPAPLPPVLRDMRRERAATTTPTISAMSEAALPDKRERLLAAARMAEAFPAKGRHMAFLALAGALANEGWPEDAITEFTLMVAKLLPYATPEDEAKAMRDRAPQARDSANAVAEGRTVAGWGTLASFVPEAVLVDSMHKLGMRDAESFAWVGTSDAMESVLATPTAGSADAWVSALLADIARTPKPPLITIPTGFAELDEKIGGGLATGQVCGVLGPPSLGKSAFVCSVSVNVAQDMNAGRWVLTVSTELETDELMSRFAGHKLGKPWRECIKGTVPREEQAAAVEGMRVRAIGCEKLPRAGGKEALKVIAYEAKRMLDEHGVAPVIVVDYLQLLARGAEENMRSRIGELSMTLRAIAQALHTPVIAVFTVKRDVYSTKQQEQFRMSDDPRVYLGAAKESGDIEYDCATILFLDVDGEVTVEGFDTSAAHAPIKSRRARVAVSRCRIGDEGFVGMKFYVASGQWVSDAGAVESMKPAAKLESKQEDQTAADDEALIMALARHPMLAWAELRDVAILGMNAWKRCDAAKARLLSAKRIVPCERYNPETGRKLKGNYYAATGTVLAPPVVREEAMDLRATLLGIASGSKT